MSDELDDFYVHTATIETREGTNGYGADVFAAPVILAPPETGCFIERRRRLVRDKAGVEVVSETTLYTSPTVAALFAPDSRVTIGSVVSLVITVAVLDSGDLDLPDHIAVNLT